MLCTPVLTSLGKYSYAMYIFHWALAPGVFARLLPEAWFFSHLRYIPGLFLRFGLVLGITYGLALLSWHVIEKQFLKLKVFFSYDRDASNEFRMRWLSTRQGLTSQS
jgi:peptidoglycan/LPS O-acetylase OafA/YrhL